MLHLGNEAVVHKAFCFSRGGNVQRDIVTLGDEVGQIDAVAHAARKAPSTRHRDVRVVPQHLHAQMGGHIGDLHADGAQAHDAQGLARKLRPGKLAFPLFHQLADGVALAGQRFGPLHAFAYLAAGQHQSAQYQFLHRIGVGARRVEHHDACLAAFVHRDIVDACARPCNAQQAFRQRHILHGGAAHQNAVGLRALLIHGKQIAGKALQPLGRNIVQCFDIVHFRFPLFRLCVCEKTRIPSGIRALQTLCRPH